MAHYAFLDENNIVTEVIPGRNEDEVVDGISDWEAHYGEIRNQVCKRTSYNHNYRKNFAGIGFEFRTDLNVPDGAFVEPQPFPSWILNEDTCRWEPPVSRPNEPWNRFVWSEEEQDWKQITIESAY